MIILEEISNGT